MPLPRKVGPFTLMRKLASDAVADAFVAILDAPAGKQVVAHRLLPALSRDPARLAAVRARVGDLAAVRPHPALTGILGIHDLEGETWILEDQADGTDLASFLAAAGARGVPVPHNVYLHLAVQLCNALEGLHTNQGSVTGGEHVLHQALSPSTVWVATDGRLTVGQYGLTRSSTEITTHAAGALPTTVEYLSPEQTHQDQKLTPASDLFSLGALLYELLTFRSLFRAESNLQTIHRLRRAEVTTQLLEVKELLPGLDRLLFRALSLNARHRYQRAFLLREDLRALMADYSFADIDAATRQFLEPTIAAVPSVATSVDGSALGRAFHASAARERTQDLLSGVPDDRFRRSPLTQSREEGPPDAPPVPVSLRRPAGRALGEETAALLGGDLAALRRLLDPRPTDPDPEAPASTQLPARSADLPTAPAAPVAEPDAERPGPPSPSREPPPSATVSPDVPGSAGALPAPGAPPGDHFGPPVDFASMLADDDDLNPLRSGAPLLDLRPAPSAFATPPGSLGAGPRARPPAAGDSSSLEADLGPGGEPGRTLLGPALGLIAVVIAAGAAVFLCVGGSGLFGLIQLGANGATRDPPAAIPDRR